MIYHIEQTLEYLRYMSWGILLITLLFLEIKNFKEQLTDDPSADSGRSGFIPPHGNGWEYYVSSSTIVYILKKAKNRFRVYLIQGEKPFTHLKHDHYGVYFTVRAEEAGTAEKIVDQLFREGLTNV